MSTTLTKYITEVRRLLHDGVGNFFDDSELTSYINSARQRLVRDTGCLRNYQTSATVANQETYNFSSLPQASKTIDIINLNVIWGNTRIPLMYMPWTKFNKELRYLQNYIGRPVAFSIYGSNTIYLGPVPDQVYSMELDTVLMPSDLVNGTDVDEIPDPWTTPVAFYAAYKAKYKEQSYGEADIFKNEYVKQVQNIIAGTYTRRLPTPYSQTY